MSTKKIARTAIIAAVYVALCVFLLPFSFGTVQLRVSEALTLLPVICPEAVIGVTLGCLISNMIGSSPIDMVVGTLATLLAALATRKLHSIRWKGLPLAAAIPPIVINALIIGAEVTLLYFDPPHTPTLFLLNMGSVGLGQLVSCGVLGVLLIWGIEHNPPILRLFSDSKSGNPLAS